MTTELKTYPEYKDTGVPWLGDIPAHWERAHGGAVLQQKKISNRGMIENTVLSLSYGRIVVKPPEKLHGLVPTSFETYQVVDPGDIIIRPTDLQNDWNTIRVGFVQDRGIITSAYICLRVRDPLSAEYAHLLLLGYDLKKIFYGMGSGLRQNLDWSDFKRMPILLPSPDEQKTIVRFIRDMDKKVNRFIQNRRRLIAVLNEQKQAIINRAVTRGINPNVRLKPSGIDWLGEIPEHWEVKPLKHLAIINSRVLPESVDKNYTFKYFDISSVGTGRLVREPETIQFGEAPSRARRILQKGDTILSMVRTYLKAVYYVADDVEDWIASTGFATLTPKKEIHPPFLGLLMQSDNFINQVIQNSIGVAYPAIAETKLGVLHVAYPRSIEEQKEILGFIADESKAFDQTIIRAQREIDLIREYRTRLITDVVTGKVDVRHLTPDIDDELAEPVDMDDDIVDDIVDEEALGDEDPELDEEVADAND